jgi:hypothetical protein
VQAATRAAAIKGASGIHLFLRVMVTLWPRGTLRWLN